MRGAPYLEDRADEFFFETIGRAKNLSEHSILAGQQIDRRVDRNSFRRQMQKRGILSRVKERYAENAREYSPSPDEPAPRDSSGRPEKPLSDRLYSVLKKRGNAGGKTVEELADELDVSPRKIRAAAKELEEDKRHIPSALDVLSAYVLPGIEERVAVEVEPTETLYVGVVSDTHLASKHQQPTALKAFMENAAESSPLSCWLHVGDLCDGVPSVYRGHVHELWITGCDEQVEYAAEAYPDTGVPTYIIGGNHDQSAITVAGTDPIQAFASLRDDVTPMGWRGAYVDVGGVSFYLHHGTGGLGYARSYKVQKLVDGFSDTNKPHILLAGHWHSFCWVWARNVHAFLCPSFQSTTTYIKSLGYESMIGGMVLEIGLDDYGEPLNVTPHLTKLDPVPGDFPRGW